MLEPGATRLSSFKHLRLHADADAMRLSRHNEVAPRKLARSAR
jgi:hypothetical protein